MTHLAYLKKALILVYRIAGFLEHFVRKPHQFSFDLKSFDK